MSNLAENVGLLTGDLENCRLLLRKQFCSSFVDGSIDEENIEAFKVVNDMLIHLSEAMENEAALLISIDTKLNSLLKQKD